MKRKRLSAIIGFGFGSLIITLAAAGIAIGYYGIKETVRAMEAANSTDPEKMYAALMANGLLAEWIRSRSHHFHRI